MNNVAIPKRIPFSQEQWKKAMKLYLDPNFKNKAYLTLINNLVFKPADMSNLSTPRKFIAFDTETYASNGNLICLSNSENLDTLYGTVTHQPSIDDYYKYFVKLQQNNKNAIFGAWNLKFDAMILLKSMPVETMYLFFYGDTDEKYTFTFPSGLQINYLPKKALTLKKNNHSVILYDFLQFFGGSLEKNAITYKTYLEEKGVKGSKEYTGKYQDKQFPDEIEPDELREIVKYCQKDCVLSAKLMEIWIDAFYKNFGFYPDRYYSAGYLSKKYLTTKFETFPTFVDVPYAVNALAYNAYWGGRFEITRKGKLSNIHHVDINSAYPYAMTQVPDFEHGKWKKVNRFDQCCDAGYYKIKVNVKEKDIAPFPFRDIEGQVLFPRGKFTTFVTHHELDSAIQGGYDFDLLELTGYEFYQTSKDKTGFNKLVQNMYDKRLEMAKIDKSQSTVYKVLVNSLYGKFAQAKPTPKGLFNPIFAAYITGKCRAMLLDAAKDHKDNIVMFATDGIFSDKKLPVNITKDKVLGAYDYEFHPDFTLIMAGIYSYNTVKDPTLNTQSRGFSLRTFVNEEDKQATTFNLNEYELKQEKDKYFYEFWNVRPLSISETVIQHKFDPSQIGKFRKVKKEIDINGDKKRLWNGLLHGLDETVYSKTNKIGLI